MPDIKIWDIDNVLNYNIVKWQDKTSVVYIVDDN
jgi:hypothetical protein